nr:PREDICTED: G protein-activated inward rectifier potassium channel 3-like isoform X2 [Lepisosteus oculatus]
MTRKDFASGVHTPPLVRSSTATAMLAAGKGGPGPDGQGLTGAPGAPPAVTSRGRRASVSAAQKLKSTMVVQSRGPGDTERHPSAFHTETVLVADSLVEGGGQVSSGLPLPDIMPSEHSRPPPLPPPSHPPMRRHKSTTDIPYSPQRGPLLRGQRPSLCSAGDLPGYRRCSLREAAGAHARWYPRHALSVPNMDTSPARASRTPTRSVLSAPVLEMEKSPKLRSRLLEDEEGQAPPCPPAARELRRYVTKDGKCRVNLRHIAEPGRFLSDIFTSFVDLKYRWFLFVFMMCYVVTWVGFATLYFLDALLRGDLDAPARRDPPPCYQNVDGFLSALLFSVETQRTIGYGSRMVMSSCQEGVLLVMAQSIVGSMIDALMVGCMFVKISRPKKRAQTLLFSRTCVIANRDDQLCLMFRLGDLRESHMVDAKVRAKLIQSRQTSEGEFLPLEQTEIDLGYETGSDRLFLVEPQVIQHTIDPNSPFWELGPDQLRRQQFEIIVILEGIVEATAPGARSSWLVNSPSWKRWFHRFHRPGAGGTWGLGTVQKQG